MTAARAMSERELQENVIAMAQLLGWRVQFTWSSVHSPAGWPDLFMVRVDRALAAELKTERGKVTTAQREWLDRLAAVGVETAIWRPSDWLSGQIEEVLR